MSTKYLFFHNLGGKEEHFGLATKYVEVSSSYFSIFSIDREDFSNFWKTFSV
jgi:hypothetical protein